MAWAGARGRRKMIAVLQHQHCDQAGYQDGDTAFWCGGKHPPGDQRVARDQHEGNAIDPGVRSQAGQQKIVDLRIPQQIPRNLGKAGRQHFQRYPEKGRGQKRVMGAAERAVL